MGIRVFGEAVFDRTEESRLRAEVERLRGALDRARVCLEHEGEVPCFGPVATAYGVILDGLAAGPKEGK